jgi:hypothetical protein
MLPFAFFLNIRISTLEPVCPSKADADPVHILVVTNEAFPVTAEILDISLQIWIIPEREAPYKFNSTLFKF